MSYQQQGYQEQQGGYRNIQSGSQGPYVPYPPPNQQPAAYDPAVKVGYGSAGQPEPVVGMTAPLMAGTQMGTPIYDDSCPNQTVRQKFVTQGYKDWPFAIAFVLQLIAVIGVAIYNGVHDKVRFNVDPSGRPYVEYIAGAFLAAIFLCFLAMLVMRFFPRGFIWAANILSILICIGLAGFCFTLARGGKYTGVIFLLLAALHGLWLFFVRRRIPFAAVLLSYSIRTVTKYWGTMLVSFFSLPLTIAFFFSWAAMAFPTLFALENAETGAWSDSADDSYHCYYTNNTDYCVTSHPHSSRMSIGGLYGLSLFFLLLFYWSTQVITNVVHVTASGTVATWFFAGNDQMPRHPSWLSAKRAMTTSFGSICFGSLLVAILKLIHTILRSQRGRAGFLGCVALCLIGFIERLLQYFNVYAFTHVAIYGMGYIDAAKATWEMICQCGWSAVFNDNLVEPVLMLTSFINSLAIGVVLGVLSSSVVTGFICFFASFIVHILLLRVVYSGIVTIFVCYAENSQVLAFSNPQFHQELEVAHEELKRSAC